MFEIIQKLAPAPPTGLYSPVAPLNTALSSPILKQAHSHTEKNCLERK